MEITSLKQKVWWDYLEEDLQELMIESVMLAEKVPSWAEAFHDYSFVVFPASKAYEGFLKKMFLDMGFITEDDFFGKRFRVGKALNPQLERHLREKESVYDRIVHYCGGKHLADKMWNTWKTCRNLLFHWFPNEKRAVSFEEAKGNISLIIDTIDGAFIECKIPKKD